MFGVRLYVCLLAIVFLVLATMDGKFGILEGVVVTSVLVYAILDAREEWKLRKADLRQLESLEKQLSVLLGD